MEKIKYFKARETGNNSKLDFKQILKGVILATVISTIFLLIAATVLTYTDVSMSFVRIVSNVTFYVGAFISGAIGSLKLKSYGWLHGVLAGGIYACVIFIVNILSSVDGANLHLPLLKIFLSVVTGGVGGILGVNFRPSKNKRR